MASLSFASAKYNQRAGRAELLADLFAAKHEFKLVKDKSPVVIEKLIIDGKEVRLTNTSEIVESLKTNKDIILIDKSNKQYSLASLDKASAIAGTKSGFNAGDVAEGVFAISLAARFLNKADTITERHLVEVQQKINRITEKSSSINIPSPNANPKVIDEIKLTINLAETNLNALFRKDIFTMMKDVTSASLHYVNEDHVKHAANLLYLNNQKNTITIVSDGIGDQTGTKMDVSVKVSDKSGQLKEFELNVSLKAGDVKQFGQVGGSGFDKQKKLFGEFGIVLNSTHETKYNELMLISPIKALQYSYGEAVKLFNQLRDKESILKSAITKFMIGDEDIILVQLNKTSSQYDPKKLNFIKVDAKLLNDPEQVSDKLKTNTDKLPKIQFFDSGFHVLDIRVKVENGSYVRNYIEKGKQLHSRQVV